MFRGTEQATVEELGQCPQPRQRRAGNLTQKAVVFRGCVAVGQSACRKTSDGTIIPAARKILVEEVIDLFGFFKVAHAHGQPGGVGETVST